MQFIHCEIYQGEIAAAHLEFPVRELYGPSDRTLESQVIRPVVFDQIGEVIFLHPVRTLDEAIAVAKTQIERNNYSYMAYMMEELVPADNAVQHFEDCGMPVERI